MNILFISKLHGGLYAGPSYSVPARIIAQSLYDNVFWYNINQIKRPEWTENGLDCKNLEDFSSGRLKDLPKPFNKPDLVVIEQLYNFPFCKIIMDLQMAEIPYVIVPRSTMTAQAQKKKPLKKFVGNILWFNRMVKKAVAVQYLTKKEAVESSKWKVNSFIVPNGIYPQEETKSEFSKDGIKATYIGRFETYQKGLDLLIRAISEEKDLLREAKFLLNLYGPNQEGSLEELKKMARDLNIEDLIAFNNSVFKDEKKKVLLDTDVFVMTSRFEGLPMGMIEALAYGLPCLATVGTNLSEEIANFDAGWIAENTVESIKHALRNMVQDKDNFKVKSKNAINMAGLYSWDAIARESHEIYKRLLASK